MISPNEVKISWSYDGEVGMPDMDEFVVNYRVRINRKETEGYQARVVKGGRTRDAIIDSKFRKNLKFEFFKKSIFILSQIFFSPPYYSLIFYISNICSCSEFSAAEM